MKRIILALLSSGSTIACTSGVESTGIEQLSCSQTTTRGGAP